MSDLELINLIREDKINLLIDLSGHSAKNRLPIFINKPAPLQITWCGYLNTTGLKEIDYIIADPFVIDEDQESFFVEKVWRLPDIWNSFSQPNYNIKVGTLPAIKNKFITFGSFNHLNKMNNSVIKLWSTLLKKIPKSKTYEEEMASEPWYYVGPNDVFPEEFQYFMLPSKHMKETFNDRYQKLLDAEYWGSIQENIKKNGVMDYYPYGSEKRMCEIYGESNE